MKENICKLIFGFLSLFLVACDPIGEINDVIQNDSSYDLDVIFIYQTLDSTFTDTVVIAMHEDSVIASSREIGGIHQWSDCLGRVHVPMLAIEVNDQDSLSVQKDPNVAANWRYQILDESSYGAGSCECRLVITNDDIL